MVLIHSIPRPPRCATEEENMLYIGNFSYTDNREDTDNICLMPLMVEASSADAALERFT